MMSAFSSIYSQKITVPSNLFRSSGRRRIRYERIRLSVAIHEGVDVFVSRDVKLRRKTVGLLPVKEPEELAASG